MTKTLKTDLAQFESILLSIFINNSLTYLAQYKAIHYQHFTTNDFEYSDQNYHLGTSLCKNYCTYNAFFKLTLSAMYFMLK